MGIKGGKCLAKWEKAVLDLPVRKLSLRSIDDVLEGAIR